jgi:peptidoglycan/xylan/chitin deacetylase (PgdA/CDA1 family)
MLYAVALIGGAALARLTSSQLATTAAQGAEPEAAEAVPAAPPDAADEPSNAESTELTKSAPAAAASDPPSSAPDSAPDTSAIGAAFKQGKIITGATPHRLILFTFDDGPDPRTTPLLLDRLDDAGIKAVFFLVASRMAQTVPMEREQALIGQEIVRRGHLVGGHTFDHAMLPGLDDAAVEVQLHRSDEIFERVFGARPALFRPPFGAHSTRIDQIVAAHRETIVLWNLGAGDFQVRSADEVYDTWLKVFERRERENGDRGGIVLLHDTYAWSVDAFQRIVSDLMARNCALLDHGEELFDFVDDPTFFYAPRAGAPADAEAPPAQLPPEILEQRQAVLRERTARRCKSMASAY